MNAGVYMTCNQLPDFGEERVNIERRLAIYQSRTLASTSSEAPEWMRKNAMSCLVWTINQINSHADLLDPEERFYELPFNVSASAFVVENVPAEEIEKIKSASIVDLDIVPSRRVACGKYCFLVYVSCFFFLLLVPLLDMLV